jgi:endonuclease/exonuclease/phosphatase family metal-dependent hydrolase
MNRILAVLGALVVLAIAYRVVFVYQLRPGGCVAAGRALVIAPAQAARAEAPTPSAPPLVPRAAPPSPRRPVRVLSYNIGGHAELIDGDYLEEIAGVIRAQRPDVAALQEVHRGTWQARFHDQPAELARLTGMKVYFGGSFRSLGGELGNAILTGAEVRDAEVVPLPSLGEPRSLLRARLDVGGTELDVITTHLAAWGGLSRRIRTRQAHCLAERARAAGRRFVLCGDFNATPPSAELAALLGGDLMRLSGVATDATHPLLGQRIDYILAGPGWQVGGAAVLKIGPSDHWPITAELTPVERAPAARRQRGA